MPTADRLSIREVSAGYPGVPVLDGLSLEAPPGRLTGLIGANGAGKSTLFDVVCGRLRARRGRILLGGREAVDIDITHTPTHRRARLGLGRTYQRLEVFGSLSVAENLLVAARAAGGTDPGRAVADTLRRLGLADFAAYPAGRLPTGIARLVEIARALAGGAGVLLLDEPSSGMAAAELTDFARTLRTLAADGLALLMIEHDMELVEAVCDEVYELREGKSYPSSRIASTAQ
ncbi:ATP-binding cassette domain-containing protein [Actinospica sp.]|jgi:branched-chain amino acid transport system ATP-binding protein|uniref:ATP-binding cassette domain-containing protein n=1 Tax=Actinospica sp. TaxID=1872142 RepID=UPI002C260274|nr:ATP-binding cassette domain-containing protein [Actinospica sp.]HWG24922.1 ATP-binding cassette domain-containing protein [Actinospica sp.]